MRNNWLSKMEGGRFVSLTMLFLISLGIGIFLIIGPQQLDDYWYSNGFRYWFDANGLTDLDCGWTVLKSGFPHEGIFKTWGDHIGSDNGRLSNLAAMYFMVMPKWVGASVSLFFWILGMVYGFKLAGISMKRTWIVAVAVFFWSFQIGWSQRMEDIDYQFNYILTGGLMIWFIWWVSEYDFAGWRMLPMILIGLIIGAWHEGFSVPVLAGWITLAATDCRFRKRKYIVAAIALAIGVAFIMSCPGFNARLHFSFRPLRAPALLAISVFFSNFSYFIVLFWAILRMIKGGLRKIPPLVLFAIISGCVAISLQFIAVHVRRVSWWASVISIIALLQLLSDVRLKSFPGKSWAKWSCISILGALSIAHWVAVDYYAILNAREIKRILSIMKAGKEKYIFSSLTPPRQLPLICMWTPNMEFMHKDWCWEKINEFIYRMETKKFVKFIPMSLREVSSSSGREVPGNSGVREVDGYMFVEASRIHFDPGTLDYMINSDIVMSTGLKGEGNMWITRFVSEADGQEYLYLEPNEVNIKVLIGDIVKIENLRSCR